MQEFILARHVRMFCGPTEISWKAFRTLAFRLRSIGWSDTLCVLICQQDKCEAFPWLEEIFHSQIYTDREQMGFRGDRVDWPLRREDGTPFWWFLQAVNMGRVSNCLDKRDKIYSVLVIISRHFSNGSIAEFLAPDYKISTESLFPGVTVKSLEHTSTDEILSIARQPSSTLSLPSWSPDWSVPFRVQPLV